MKRKLMIKFSKFILIQTVIIFFIGLFPILSWGDLYIKIDIVFGSEVKKEEGDIKEIKIIENFKIMDIKQLISSE